MASYGDSIIIAAGLGRLNKHVAGEMTMRMGMQVFPGCWSWRRVNPAAVGSTTGPERLGVVYSRRYLVINSVLNLPGVRVVVIIFIVLQ